jgi:hypothetical protein
MIDSREILKRIMVVPPRCLKSEIQKPIVRQALFATFDAI